jgi:hypothetical protein
MHAMLRRRSFTIVCEIYSTRRRRTKKNGGSAVRSTKDTCFVLNEET